MPTRSEEFSGLTVAMITPFRDGQVDIEALQQQVEFQIEAGTTCVCPVGTTGECPTLSHPGTRAGDLGRGRGGRRTDQGNGRHGQQQHRRGAAS